MRAINNIQQSLRIDKELIYTILFEKQINVQMTGYLQQLINEQVVYNIAIRYSHWII